MQNNKLGLGPKARFHVAALVEWLSASPFKRHNFVNPSLHILLMGSSPGGSETGGCPPARVTAGAAKQGLIRTHALRPAYGKLWPMKKAKVAKLNLCIRLCKRWGTIPLHEQVVFFLILLAMECLPSALCYPSCRVELPLAWAEPVATQAPLQPLSCRQLTRCDFSAHLRKTDSGLTTQQQRRSETVANCVSSGMVSKFLDRVLYDDLGTATCLACCLHGLPNGLILISTSQVNNWKLFSDSARKRDVFLG